MSGRGTTDDILYALRQRMEKRRENQQGLHKTYDRVPRQEVWIRMREKGVPEKCVRIVLDMYGGAITQVNSSVWLTHKTPVSIGLYQRSSLIPYLFQMIMDVSACRINDLSPWCLLRMTLYCVAPEEKRWKRY